MSSNVFRIISVLVCAFLISACASTPPPNLQQVGFTETGVASYYAMKYQFRKTASGERFNQSANTAAHKTLPFNSRVRVTNLANGKSTIVRINDRGPFIEGRIIDLSRSAFSDIAEISAGVARVKIEVID
ncbi:MAG: septal ring lytic transglycosylase RlpA family protein [Idiomarina sp.]|nr:septal ring lytic transglycosylase RlpA family protein [Idiomarina sp.]